MSQGTPSSPPQSPPAPSAPNAGAPIVYALPQQRPGVIRTLLSALTRFVLILLAIFFAFILLAGLIQMVMQRSTGPRVVGYRTGNESQQVAVLDLDGTIDDRAAEHVRSCVEYVLDTPSIKAVVLRVNSPGGGITASDHIWYQVKRLIDNEYPVVASYGGISASGGVYASCHSDYIFAEPTTVTGSIGVIAQVLTFGDLLENVGVDPVTLVAGESPDKDIANDIYRDWTEEDKEKIRKILDASYETFFSRVWEGRKHVYAEQSELREVADGSIYTAEEAVQNKLIDAVGYLDDAIDYTIQQASLPANVRVVRLQPWSERLDLPFGLSGLFNRWSSGSGEGRRAPGSLDPQQARMWWYEFTRPRAMYLMPG